MMTASVSFDVVNEEDFEEDFEEDYHFRVVPGEDLPSLPWTADVLEKSPTVSQFDVLRG